MTLSKRGDYVLRSALALARAYPTGEPRKIREIVAEMGLPPTFASQILADLVRAGLASSKAGKDGGYRLARPPEQVRLVDVVEAGEGPLRADRCALGDGPCRWESVCPLHETWRAASDALRAVLATSSLADLVQRDLELEQGRTVPPADSHRHAATSLAVEDSVQVEVGCDAIATCLRSSDHLVAAAVADAYRQAEELRATLAGGPAWSPMDLSTSCTPRRAGEPGCRDLTLSFEASCPGGVSSHGDLELVASPLDPLRSELRAAGRLRLPPVGSGPDEHAHAERLAQVLVRTLLRQLARSLEESDSRPPTGHLARSPSGSR